MLGGLIAGALGGASQGISGLADQFMKEAEDAKKQAYERGLLEWKAARDDARTEREGELRIGATVLDNQMRAATVDKQIAAQERMNNADNASAERRTNAQIEAQKGPEAKMDKIELGFMRNLEAIDKELNKARVDPAFNSKSEGIQQLMDQRKMVAGLYDRYKIEQGKVTPEQYASELIDLGKTPDQIKAVIDGTKMLNPGFSQRLEQLLAPRMQVSRAPTPSPSIIGQAADYIATPRGQLRGKYAPENDVTEIMSR